LRHIQSEESRTVIFVTHDLEEAVFLVDRIVVFSRCPPRVIEDIDITSLLESMRSLALRDSETFFRTKTRTIQMVREMAGVSR